MEDAAGPWDDDGPGGTLGSGRYVLGELIGRGGVGKVVRAHDRVLGRPVAIKLFELATTETGAEAWAEPEATAEQERRRWREVRTLAALNHPGLVGVYDVGEQDGQAFFVMQLIEGPTLAQHLRAGPMPLGQTLRLGAALAGALGYVHRHGVTHRDVKPANVLVDDTGRPYLGDFGNAVLADSVAITADGVIIGTASYLAPEQVRGQLVGPPADIYALGLVLLECLTGHCEYPCPAPPLDPVDPADTAGEGLAGLVDAATARLHRPPRVPPQLPAAVARVLTAMTAAQPAERPDADTLTAGLHALLPPDAGDRAGAMPVLSPLPAAGPTSAGPTSAGPTSAAGATGADDPPGRLLAASGQPRRPRLRAVLLAAASLIMVLAVATSVSLGQRPGLAAITGTGPRVPVPGPTGPALTGPAPAHNAPAGDAAAGPAAAGLAGAGLAGAGLAGAGLAGAGLAGSYLPARPGPAIPAGLAAYSRPMPQHGAGHTSDTSATTAGATTAPAPARAVTWPPAFPSSRPDASNRSASVPTRTPAASSTLSSALPRSTSSSSTASSPTTRHQLTSTTPDRPQQ